MKKAILKLQVHDVEEKKEVEFMKTVSGFSGCFVPDDDLEDNTSYGAECFVPYDDLEDNTSYGAGCFVPYDDLEDYDMMLRPSYSAAELFKVDTSYKSKNPPPTRAKKDAKACVIL